MAGSATSPEVSQGVKDKAKKSAAERKREMYCTDNTEPWPTRYRQAVYSWR